MSFRSVLNRTLFAAALTISLLACAGAAKLSNRASNFIANAEAVVLRDCTRPLPSKSCRQGRLLNLGKPEEWDDQNRGDSATNQTAEYEGMDLFLHRERLVALTVTSPAWPLPEGLRVGMLESAVEKALGPPTRRGLDAGNQVLEYSDDDGLASATFEIDPRSGSVIAVRWAFFYD